MLGACRGDIRGLSRRSAHAVTSSPRCPALSRAGQKKAVSAVLRDSPGQTRQQQDAVEMGRRHVILLLTLPTIPFLMNAISPAEAVVKGYEPMPALKDKDYGKPRMSYSDYITTPSGLQYQDLVQGTGSQPREGQTVVVDWSGVTIGYYGRPFEARNKPRGGAFTGDEKEFFRFKLGDSTIIPAFNEAISSMKEGGIRRIIVPVELGYPNNDFNNAGPAPSTFSGRRALDFVLKNQGLIDKTLLFDIELIKVL